MGPTNRGGRGSSGGGDIEDGTTNHLLDSIGKKVYDEVKNGEANQYKDDLKGNLASATEGSSETAYTENPCTFEYDKLINGSGGNGERHPCKNLKGITNEERFSDKIGGQCTKEKISGSTNTCGACAPFRRLHLCHHNLESIDTTSTKHDLLAEVCMAAKYEAESLIRYHDQYEATYPSSGSTMCTMLARSFADIGDIVRGKDLYRGNNEEKKQREQLDEKLKTIFGIIYEELKNGKTNGQALQTYYKDDTDKKNFYRLREDWWTANRHTVWKALTCSKELDNSSYFHATCNGKERTKGYCRCNGDQPGKDNPNTDPPTYFDYVPQYLRWFEEWAEDFCRLRKHKLEDAKSKCRRPKGQHKYCDLNRYDCVKTIRGDHDFVQDEDCKGCQYSCARFVNWIDNQKLEFLKQREKYGTEISDGGAGGKGRTRKKRSARGSNDNGYEKIFYEKLKSNGYQTVDKFLEKLSDEEVCTKNSEIEDGGKIDFAKVSGSSAKNSDGNNETFYRTTYCEACPWCGVNGTKGNWTPKNDNVCNPGNVYTNYTDTKIPILTGDKGQLDILKKYNKFCNGNGGNGAPAAAPATTASGDNATTGYCGGNIDSSLCEKWTCYYKEKKNEDGSGAINFCVLQNGKQEEKDKTFSSYNAFFWDWVHDMLIDSIKWRNEHGKCINNNTNGNTCITGCKSKCDCFLKWVQQKEKEWKNIVKHFKKQGDIEEKGDLAAIMTPDIILKLLLEEDELLEIIEGTYGKSKETEHIRKMLEKENEENQEPAGANGKKNIMDKLIEHELQEAEKCKQKQEECQRQKQLEEQESRGRSAAGPSPPAPTDPQPRANQEDSDDGEEDEDANDEEEGTHKATGEEPTAKESEAPKETTTTQVKPCDIVKDLFEKPKNTFKKACEQKYSEPNRYWGWKCIPTSGDKAATGDKGSICVPPRRRKLYVGKLEEWAKSDKTESSQAAEPRPSEAQPQSPVASSNSQGPTQASTSSPSNSRAGDLLKAFVESAAVETFFLWHRYKKEWDHRKNKAQNELGGAVGVSLFSGVSQAGHMKALVPGAGGEEPQLTSKNSDDPQSPQSKLQESGTIPNDFLRLMFYTLGDYRDICVGKTPDGIDTVSASGDNPNKKVTMNDISERIQKILKGDNNQESGGPPSHAPGKKNPVQTPKDWWENNAKYIWEGMVCALTYKDSEQKGGGGNPTVDEEVRAQLWDKDGKPKNDNYTYENVELKDEKSDTQARTNPQTTSSTSENTPTTLNNPKLTQFVEIPTFFRYLHEWGQNFCTERKKRLEEVRKACREKDNGDDTFCSGDGHDCRVEYLKHNDMSADPGCPGCAKECMKYKKWIDIKFEEYHNQEKKYKDEYGKIKANSSGDNTCCEEIKKHTTADKFLKELKHCKNAEGDKEKGNELDFDKIPQTFSRSTYCKTCPLNGVNCTVRRGKSGKDPCTPVNGNENTWKEVFDANGENSTANITVEMIDRRAPFIKNYSQNDLKKSNDLFKTSKLFKGVRKQKWECKVTNDDMHICKLDQFKDNIDLNEYTTFKVLLHYWLEDFIEGYYILKQKKIIDKCTENGGETCNGQPKNGCACVKVWVEQKKDEWGKIQERFNEQYKSKTSDEYFNVRSFLETLIPRMDLTNGKKKIQQLNEFLRSYECNCADSSQNSTQNDVVLCLLTKLEDKANKCKDQTSGEEKHCGEYTSPEPDEDLTLEEENTLDPPKICPEQPKEEAKEKVEEKCGKDEETRKEKEKEKQKEREASAPSVPATEEPTNEVVEEKTSEAEPPSRQPRPALDDPAVIPSLVTSTLAWSVGIGFAAFTYFFLKVLYIYMYIYVDVFCLYICVRMFGYIYIC